MKIKHIEGNTGGNLKFEVGGVIMYFWDSFKRSFISLDDFSQSYNFNKVMFKDTPEDITAWIEKNEEFVAAYINKALKEQALLDSYKELPDKKLVVRKDTSVLIVTVSCKSGYVSFGTNEVMPTKEKELRKQGTEMWMDYYVNEQGLSKKEARNNLRNASLEDLADISLFSGGFTFRNADYAFDSIGCGSTFKEIKQLFPENKTLHKLFGMHIKKDIDMVEAIWLHSQLKGSENYREEVINVGKEIIKK